MGDPLLRRRAGWRGDFLPAGWADVQIILHARRLALGVCDALTRAHDLNIIHRDIKPENVLMVVKGRNIGR